MSEGKGADAVPASSAPSDPRSLVYAIFYWLGIGTLLPWNFFISVPGYWSYKWDDVPRTNGTAESPENKTGDGGNSTDGGGGDEYNEMQTAWNAHMAMASMVPNVTMLLLNAAFGHHFRTQPRLLVSLVLVIVLFVFTDAMTMIDTDGWQREFYFVTLISVVAINVNAAIFQGGLLGVAGKFPPRYIGGVLSGQSLGGIFASATNVLFIAVGGGAVLAASCSFLIAVLFLGTALAAYAWVTRLEFFQFYVGDEGQQSGKKAAKPTEAPATEENGVPEDSKLVPEVEVKGKPAMPTRKPNPLLILLKISLYAASVFLVFVVTLGAFPAVTVLVKSTSEAKDRWTQDFFVPVTCFLLFNVGDWLGRILAERLQWPRPGRLGATIMFVLCLLRFAFIPLFMLCNVNPSEHRPLPVAFHSDAAYVVIMILFSVTNGYAASITMMSAPQVSQF